MENIDRVALVTGASAGIGQAIATLLASNGWIVGLLARRRQRLEEVAQAIERNGGQAHVLVGDVTDAQFTAAAVSELVAKTGRLDLLVNNAGALTQTAVAVTDAMIDAVWALNVRAAYRLCLISLPHLETSGGSIVNIGSAAVARNFAMDLPYLASKGALEALSKGMAKVWGARGVRVNVVSPGVIATEALASTGLSPHEADAQFAKFAQSMQAMERRGQVEDVASAVAYLASPEAAFITGALLQVDGGTALGG